MVDGRFMDGLLLATMNAPKIGMNIVNKIRVNGNQIGRQRQVLFDNWADVTKTDWLLWIDSDIVVTPDSLKLVWDSADKVSRPVVSGTYFVSKENERSLMQPFPALFKDGSKKNEMQIVSKFNIIDQFDTIKNLRNGVYASRLYTYDSTNKIYTSHDYDYNLEYEKSMHTEPGKNGERTDNTGILPLHNREGKFLSDFKNTSVYLWTNTSDIHDNVVSPDPKNYLQKRLSQRLAFASFKLEITVPGFTGLTAGDLITFEMPSYQPYGEGQPRDNDPYMSGRYLISSIRHQLNRKSNKHIMILECIKDSVRTPYPEENIDTFSGKEKDRRGVIDIYELDKQYTNALNTFF
jgi:hypothetical protein